MPVAEPAFRLRTNEDHSAVGVQVPLPDQVAHDRFAAAVKRGEAVPLLAPRSVPDAVLLETEREDLLGDDVAWLRGRNNRLNPVLSPQQEQAGGPQQRAIGQHQEKTVAYGARPASGAAQTLQKRRNSAGCVQLDDPVKIADIDAQFQRARRDDHTVPGLRERLLRTAPLVRGQ